MTKVAIVRINDFIRIVFCNNNSIAFEDLVRFFGRYAVNNEHRAVDFDLDFVPKTGFTLNGKVVDVKSALGKTRFNGSLGRACISIADHQADLPEYNLDDVKAALTHAAQTGDAAILNHDHELETLQEFRHIGASGIFRDVFYILIGGFGGLGLLLMEWMLNNVARNFAVISRSGAPSKGAQTATQKMDALGGEILAIKADADDAQAMHAATSTLRLIMPIGGCF